MTCIPGGSLQGNNSRSAVFPSDVEHISVLQSNVTSHEPTREPWVASLISCCASQVSLDKGGEGLGSIVKVVQTVGEFNNTIIINLEKDA